MISRRDQAKNYLNEESGFDDKFLHHLEEDLKSESNSPKKQNTDNLTKVSENLKQKLESFKSEMSKGSQSMINNNLNFNPAASMIGMSLNLSDFGNITPIRGLTNDWTVHESDFAETKRKEDLMVQQTRTTLCSKVVEQDISNLKARLQYSEAEILALKSSEVKKSLEIKDLEMKVSVLEEEIEELDDELSKRKRLIEKLKEQLFQCRNEIDQLNEQLEKARGEISRRDALILELLRLLLENNPSQNDNKLIEIGEVFGNKVGELARSVASKQQNAYNEQERLAKVVDEQKQEIQRWRDRAANVFNLTKQVDCGPELTLNDLWQIIKTQALRIEQMHTELTKYKENFSISDNKLDENFYK